LKYKQDVVVDKNRTMDMSRNVIFLYIASFILQSYDKCSDYNLWLGMRNGRSIMKDMRENAEGYPAK
jgi:hypothetical protein